jgi:hypothetical protein
MAGAAHKVIVTGIQSDQIVSVWLAAWPLLEKAAQRFPNAVKPDLENRLIEEIVSKKTQLWVAYDYVNGLIVGAVTTKLTHDKKHPGKSFIEVPLIGGVRFPEWRDQLWLILSAWGRSKKCTHMLGFGRKGWVRVYGFEECGVTDEGVLIFCRALEEN